jgi:PAS domain S-box-containing protein
MLLSAAAADYFFTPPFFNFGTDLQGLLSAAFFIGSSSVIGWMTDRLQRTDAARKNLIEVLHSKEQELNSVLSSQSDVVVRYDRHMVITFVNDALCRLFGEAREAFVDHRRLLNLVPEDQARVRSDLGALTPQKTDLVVENRVVDADGVVRWIQWAVHGEFDAAGALSEVQGTGRDITERLHLEEQLAEASARIHDLFDNAPCGYHSLDAQGRILEINATEVEWLQSTKEQLLGRPINEFFGAMSQMDLDNAMSRLRAGEAIDGKEFDLVVRGKVTRRVSVSATAVKDASGQFVKTHSVMFDISRLHAAREQARRLSREQAVMLDNDLVGMVRLRDRRSVWHNRALATIFGYGPDELAGQDARILYLDDASYAALGSAAYPVVLAGNIYRTQVPMRRKDGTAVWIDLSGMSVSPDGAETLWSLIDISPLKQAEELRVRAAGLDAENRQLRELARLQRNFTANVTHEMRTPLNAVLGTVQLLRMKSLQTDEAKAARYIDRIDGAGRELLQMIDRIIDMSRADTEQLEITPEPVSLRPLVDEVIAAQQSAAASKQIELRVDVDPGLTDIELDPLRFKQVLQAYLDNAVHFTPASGHVAVRVQAEGQAHLRIEVEDDGIGIAEEDLPKLFQSYTQLSTGFTKAHPGLGIGLALTRRIAEAQGGSVGVRSLPGRGSTFHAVLAKKPPINQGRRLGDRAVAI